MGSWEYQVGDNLHTNLYAQYFANSAAYFNSDNYTFRSDWVTDGFWNSYYVGVLKQFKNVKEIVAEKPQYDNIYQVMRIFTARCTAQTTDMFGDIPYTEAATGTSNAKYDSQQSIYTDLFKELTEAVYAKWLRDSTVMKQVISQVLKNEKVQIQDKDLSNALDSYKVPAATVQTK